MAMLPTYRKVRATLFSLCGRGGKIYTVCN